MYLKNIFVFFFLFLSNQKNSETEVLQTHNVMRALKNRGNALIFASSELQKDKDIVLQSIQNTFSIQFEGLENFTSLLIQKLLADKKLFLKKVVSSKSIYIFLEFVELYLMVFQEKELQIPDELRHKLQQIRRIFEEMYQKQFQSETINFIVGETSKILQEFR
jgi:hypothetical protein